MPYHVFAHFNCCCFDSIFLLQLFSIDYKAIYVCVLHLHQCVFFGVICLSMFLYTYLCWLFIKSTSQLSADLLFVRSRYFILSVVSSRSVTPQPCNSPACLMPLVSHPHALLSCRCIFTRGRGTHFTYSKSSSWVEIFIITEFKILSTNLMECFCQI